MKLLHPQTSWIKEQVSPIPWHSILFDSYVKRVVGWSVQTFSINSLQLHWGNPHSLPLRGGFPLPGQNTWTVYAITYLEGEKQWRTPMRASKNLFYCILYYMILYISPTPAVQIYTHYPNTPSCQYLVSCTVWCEMLRCRHHYMRGLSDIAVCIASYSWCPTPELFFLFAFNACFEGFCMDRIWSYSLSIEMCCLSYILWTIYTHFRRMLKLNNCF